MKKRRRSVLDEVLSDDSARSIAKIIEDYLHSVILPLDTDRYVDDNPLVPAKHILKALRRKAKRLAT
jgi:hypothetical protein